MLATRFFMNFFAVEILFGGQDHFGKHSDAAVHEIADVLRLGMLAREPGAGSRQEHRSLASVGQGTR